VRISTFQDLAEGAEAKPSPLSQEPSLHILIRPSIEKPLFASLLAANGGASREEKVSRNRFSLGSSHNLHRNTPGLDR